MDDKYALYWAPDNSSIIVECVLEHLGIDYDRRFVDRTQNQHLTPEYKKLQPFGRIPVLTVNNEPISETAAICSYLAEKHNSSLFPSVNDPKGAKARELLSSIQNNLHTPMTALFYPEKQGDNVESQTSIREGNAKIIQNTLQVLENTIDPEKGPYLLGQNISINDFYMGAILRWITIYPENETYFDKGFEEHPRIHKLLSLLEEEPAVRKAFTNNGLEEDNVYTRPTFPKVNKGITQQTNFNPKPKV